jgi:hypothetical protein
VKKVALSFPALSYETPRAFRAVAKGFNMYGEPITVEGTEFGKSATARNRSSRWNCFH